MEAVCLLLACPLSSCLFIFIAFSWLFLFSMHIFSPSLTLIVQHSHSHSHSHSHTHTLTLTHTLTRSNSRNAALDAELKKSHAAELASSYARQNLESELAAQMQEASEATALKGLLEAAEARAAHWQSVATAAVAAVDASRAGTQAQGQEQEQDQEQKQGLEFESGSEQQPIKDEEKLEREAKTALFDATIAENVRLSSALASARADAAQSQAQLLAAQARMQQEFTSL